MKALMTSEQIVKLLIERGEKDIEGARKSTSGYKQRSVSSPIIKLGKKLYKEAMLEVDRKGTNLTELIKTALREYLNK